MVRGEGRKVFLGCLSIDGGVFGLSENILDMGDTLTVDDCKLQLEHHDVPDNVLHVRCRCVLLPLR